MRASATGWKSKVAAVQLGLLTLCAAACSPTQAPNADKAKAELGKAIFFDSDLSLDGHTPCATCHMESRALADGRRVSIGAQGRVGTRNTPSLMDVQLYSTFFWDGRDTRLEEAVLRPFTNAVEMALPDAASLLEKINTPPRYTKLAIAAFMTPKLDEEQIGEALASYLRSLPLDATRYDASLLATNPSLLSEEEAAGLELFKGKGECVECHHLTGYPAPFTDQKFHHSGVGFEGISGNISRLIEELELSRQAQPTVGDSLPSREIAELGRFIVTGAPRDLGAFRTPSLRNVQFTAPYMHDGSVDTLSEAVEREIYYRSLARGRPIFMTVTEREQLVAFLKTLSTTRPIAAGLPPVDGQIEDVQIP